MCSRFDVISGSAEAVGDFRFIILEHISVRRDSVCVFPSLLVSGRKFSGRGIVPDRDIEFCAVNSVIFAFIDVIREGFTEYVDDFFAGMVDSEAAVRHDTFLSFR